MTRFSIPGFGFILDYPDGWEYELKGSKVSFFDPASSGGALTISSMRPPPEVVPDGKELLRQFFRVQGEEWEGTNRPGQRISYCETNNGAVYWRFWAVTRPTRAVVVTYNCRPTEIGLQGTTTDEIVRSIEVLP